MNIYIKAKLGYSDDSQFSLILKIDPKGGGKEN